RATCAWRSGRVATHAASDRQRRRRSVLGRGVGRRTGKAVPALDALREVRLAFALRRWALRAESQPLSAREDVLRPQGLHWLAWRSETARRRRRARTLPSRVPRGTSRRLPLALVRAWRPERLHRHAAFLRERCLTPDREPLGTLRLVQRSQEYGAGLRTGR